MKTQITELEDKFYNINHIVNANAIPMVDGSKWIVWGLDNMKKGSSKRQINMIADILTR